MLCTQKDAQESSRPSLQQPLCTVYSSSSSSSSEFSSDSDCQSSVEQLTSLSCSSETCGRSALHAVDAKPNAHCAIPVPAAALSHPAENGRELCSHNMRAYRCTSCGGGIVCEHKRHKFYCVPCRGEGICPHQRRRYRCSRCKRGAQPENSEGTSISRRAAASIIISLVQCAQSPDTDCVQPPEDKSELRRDKTSHILCPHNVRLYRCVPCGGTGICEHNRRRYYCVTCGGGGICPHSRRRDKCHDCKRSRSSAVDDESASGCCPPPLKFRSRVQHSPSTSIPTSCAPQIPIGGVMNRSSPGAADDASSVSTEWARGLHPLLPPLINTTTAQQLTSGLHSNTAPSAASSHMEAVLKDWSLALLHHHASLFPPLPHDDRKKRGPYAKTIAQIPSAAGSELKNSEVKYTGLLMAATNARTNIPTHRPEVPAVVLSKGCNCKHSHCLKRYCECLAAGARCSALCKCLDCENKQSSTDVHEECSSESLFKTTCATSAFPQSALEKKFIIEGDAVVHSKGCNCKHSHCLKRYCECLAAGARCSARCRCLDCKNGRPPVVASSVIRFV